MEKRVVVTMLVMMGFFMLVSYFYPVIFPPKPQPPAAGGKAPAAQSEPARAGVVGAPVASGPAAEGAAGQAPGADKAQAGSQETAQAGSQVTAQAGSQVAAQAGSQVAAQDGSQGAALEASEDQGTQGAPEPARRVTVETPEYTAVFTEEGGRLVSFRLRRYKSWDAAEREGESFQELVNRPAQADPSELPLNVVYLAPDGQSEDLRGLRLRADRAEVKVPPGGSATLVFSPAEKTSGLAVERAYEFKAGSYTIGHELRLSNGGSSPVPGRIGVSLSAWPFSQRQNRYNVLAGFINRRLVSESADDAAAELAGLRLVTSADFLGYMDQYFLTALLFPHQETAEAGAPSPWRFSAKELPGQGVAALATLPLDLAPGAGSSLRFDFFYGPKETEILKSAGHSLSRSVDLGWFSFLAHPMGYLLRFFYGFVGNYGIAIILVTILIKLALWPLTAKSYRSMKKMQKIQAPMAKLREKYKDDKAAMNKEMMALYRVHGVNPLGGCLPMLLQIPFFFAFYRVLDYAIELRGAPFTLWIQDLSAPDRLFDFGVTIPFFAPPTGIPVLTLLMGASMLWQQKMTPTMGDPMQAKMMMLLPLFFIVFLLNMPSGLVLYWLVNNILSIFQQKLINRNGGAAPAKDAPGGKGARGARPAASGK
ncbi:MAG: membrane protein insertase YidC [Deltaproteobacteria bacterium]|jgi:YidC/Oxa1 family membrane protein insertase|nr:membrane protein insertase YidC [Deltaproteobacteria bacterium]